MIKKISIFAFVCFMLFLLSHGMREISGGFRIGKVMLDPKDVVAESNIPQELKAIFEKPFRYLDQGCQTYVFESSDKNYVLKLVRIRRFHPPFWIDWIPLSEAKKRSLSLGRYHNLQNAMESYQMAKDLLAEETQVVFVHLLPSKRLPCVYLKDSLFSSKVDLNQVAFILQKKGVPLKQALLQTKGDIHEARCLVRSFIELISCMQTKNIRNRDYNCVKNAGVYQGKPLFMDTGSFTMEERPLSYEEYEERMRHFLKYFYKFSNAHYPELVGILDREIDRHLQTIRDKR